MKKRMRYMLIFLGILFGSIFLYKVIVGFFMKRAMNNQTHLVTVSAMNVKYSSWQPLLRASASLRAIRGVSVTAELAGMVETISFTPGAIVTQDAVLVQLNAKSDIAKLQALQANAELARITYERDKKQFAAQAISKETVDTDRENLKSFEAQVAEQSEIVAKKTIRAPFAGRLGVSLVNPGQYITPGDKVVTLQQLDPLYADFYVPQQEIVKLKLNAPIEMTVDAYPGKIFKGIITTIDPIVDPNTRNVQVEATIPNAELLLVPGMFASVQVDTGKPVNYLTLPQTAISFNPYGSIVFLITKSNTEKDKKPILTVNQHFVVTGDTRGDQIAILKGIKEGDAVVTSGQLKLKNGSQITINNSVVPSNDPNPPIPSEG